MVYYYSCTFLVFSTFATEMKVVKMQVTLTLGIIALKLIDIQWS